MGKMRRRHRRLSLEHGGSRPAAAPRLRLERALEPADGRTFAAAAHGNNIEAAGRRRIPRRVLLQVARAGVQEPLPLAAVYGLRGIRPGAAPAVADLYEHEGVAFPHDQVQLSAAGAEVAGQQSQPPLPQVAAGQPFGPCAPLPRAVCRFRRRIRRSIRRFGAAAYWPSHTGRPPLNRYHCRRRRTLPSACGCRRPLRPWWKERSPA